MKKILLVASIAASLCGCLSAKKASCYLSPGDNYYHAHTYKQRVRWCRGLWDLDYALRRDGKKP